MSVPKILMLFLANHSGKKMSKFARRSSVNRAVIAVNGRCQALSSGEVLTVDNTSTKTTRQP